MSVTLMQTVPAFRIDDGTLERLWWTLEAKCAEVEPATSSLTVRNRIRAAGRRTPEQHRQEYQSIDALRRASSGPTLLRDYTLSVSSPWGDNHRSVRFGALGGGSAASLEVTAPEAEWCHEVVAAVLEQLRPYRAWYALAHRGGNGAMFLAIGVVTCVTLGAILFLQQVWATVAALACQSSLMTLIMFRERLLPAADIRVERGAPALRSRERLGDDSDAGPTEDRRAGESAARREPAPRDGEGISR